MIFLWLCSLFYQFIVIPLRWWFSTWVAHHHQFWKCLKLQVHSTTQFRSTELESLGRKTYNPFPTLLASLPSSLQLSPSSPPSFSLQPYYKDKNHWCKMEERNKEIMKKSVSRNPCLRKQKQIFKYPSSAFLF